MVLLLVSFICLLLGCYRFVRKVIKKDGSYPNNKRLLICSLSDGVIAFIGVGITAPEEIETSSVEKTAETTSISTQSSSEIQGSKEKQEEEEEKQKKLAEEKKEKEEEEKQKKLAEEKKEKEEEEKQKELAEEKKEKEEREKQEKLAKEEQRKAEEEREQAEAQQREDEQLQQSQQQDDVGEMVYVTPTGEKYHSHPHGNGDFSQTTLENAQAMGLEPCKVCH